MNQINRYSVRRVTSGSVEQDLSSKDGALISSYSLGYVPFVEGKYQLNASFYTPDSIFLETEENIKTYSVLGINQGKSVTEITVDPVQDALGRGYLGDVQVEYSVTDNLFSPSLGKDSESILFIREISSDRTEIRATSTTLTEEQMQSFAQDLYRELNLTAYFKGVALKFLDEQETEAWCINVTTEVLDGDLVVTFKTYEPLPDSLDVKSRFQVVRHVGEPVRFEVVRTVEVIEEDTAPRLKGPNFDVETKSTELGTVTDYLNIKELFSFPEDIKALNLYSIIKEQGIELGIDHSDFANFIHFSSAAERLENFRYKLGLIKKYEHELELEKPEAEKERIRSLIQGIIDNFDHYDRYLYFEKTETSWPKMATDKPYINLDPSEVDAWFQKRLTESQEYDSNNPDILINTIPGTIRNDERNEPYLVFVHMIGQQFDDEWIYAKAVSERFSGDNRLDFGLSKDLVRDALKSFGTELETTNQNLSRLFDCCIPGEPYQTGSETSVTAFKRITVSTGSTEFQPVLEDDYRKQIYKRIYHNLPLLLKTKGTSRGLRALISCFGIPEELLTISVAGGANLDEEGAFFGPEYRTISSLERVRLDNTGSKAPLMFDEETGTFISGTVLSLNRQIQQRGTMYQPGTNNVEVGFRLNGQLDKQVKEYLSADSSSIFDYDDIIGDPRNTGEDYGEAFTLLRDRVLSELRDSQGNLQLRTPTAILRLIRYYDSVLFRTLQTSFVPARDEVSVGAIVDDNILHRNKYRGIKPVSNLGTEFTGQWSGSKGSKWTQDLTASIQTIYIDGGEAGSLKVLKGPRPGGKPQQVQNFIIKTTINRTVTESRECPTVDYVEADGISIGTEYVPKVVYDDSPRFTGELMGTSREVTNGELNENNRFKRGGSSFKSVTYNLDYRFLCLPRFPIDTVLKATSAVEGIIFDVDLGLSPDYKKYGTEIEGRSVSGDPVTTKQLFSETFMTLTCPRDRQQGWILRTKTTGDPGRIVNYVGVDPDLEEIFPGEEEPYKQAELERIQLSKWHLLSNPVGTDMDGEMIGAMSPGSIYSEELWNIEKSSERKLYARTFAGNRNRTLRFKIINLDRWAETFSDGSSEISLSKAGEDKLYRLTLDNVGEVVFERLGDLTPNLGNNALRKIFLYIKNLGQYVIMDFINERVFLWKPGEGADLEWTDWYQLKNYKDLWQGDPGKVLTYLDRRYKAIGSTTVMGIELKDEITGTVLEGGTEPLVLMESYMGCPWVFSQGTGTTGRFQMLIEDWV